MFVDDPDQLGNHCNSGGLRQLRAATLDLFGVTHTRPDVLNTLTSAAERLREAGIEGGTGTPKFVLVLGD